MNLLFHKMLAVGSPVFWRVLKLVVHLVSPVGSQTRLNILVYHHVLPVNENILDDGAVDATCFNWQMRLVSKVFNVMSIDVAMEKLENGNLPPRALAITFDDGYLDNYTEAFPILERYGLTACFFVVGQAISEGHIWNDTLMQAVLKSDQKELDLSEIGFGVVDINTTIQKVEANRVLNFKLKNLPVEEQTEKITYIVAQSKVCLSKQGMLSEAKVSHMASAGMGIGCHTMRHPLFKITPLEDIEEDIVKSKKYLSEIISKPVDYFAYPYGKLDQDFDQQHVELVQKLGFRAAFVSDWGTASKESNRYLISRFTPWDKSPIRFFLRLAHNFNKPG